MYLGNKPILYVVNKSTTVEFYSKVKIIRVTCKTKRYYTPLRRIAIKAINNIASPNGLVLTLLVFRAYPHIIIELPPLPLIVKRNVLALPLQSENGLYKIASIDGHNVTINIINSLTTFRLTVIKPYYRLDYL
ncbi:hypothetical protein BU23DRAFT_576115 [Bimuria novae-zelandiae CBS 107.79]|uniref:Uncharacterized protein n=1 Tax=Bimuria novae-zelandiae CBS 107.79 TaxID=1447943 RepID=A0A6A5W3E1_9PLEO|nr:hypothetical protein BU23DRAFT_576115 [Bimuria novae-zelandiae CBS 107.79]